MTFSADVPGWLFEGAKVIHTTFGAGTVDRLIDYRGMPSIAISFDSGDRKQLSVEHGLPNLRQAPPSS